MTNEEISKWLMNLKDDIGKTQYQPLWHYAEALDMAIKALEQQKRKQDKNGCHNCKYDNKSHLDEPCHTCFCTEGGTPTAWEALEQPETHEKRTKTHACDLISRQSAIDAAKKESQIDGAYGYMDTKSIINMLEDLPPAQLEIVRCKECKWYELPSHKITENCVRWMKSNGILLPIKPNDYCSYAERRTHEAD